MATTGTLDVLPATTCTGEVTLAPLAGLHTVTDGFTVLSVHPLPDCTVTVADEFEVPPAPVAVAV